MIIKTEDDEGEYDNEGKSMEKGGKREKEEKEEEEYNFLKMPPDWINAEIHSLSRRTAINKEKTSHRKIIRCACCGY
jgi:hypothetical protein